MLDFFTYVVTTDSEGRCIIISTFTSFLPFCKPKIIPIVIKDVNERDNSRKTARTILASRIA